MKKLFSRQYACNEYALSTEEKVIYVIENPFQLLRLKRKKYSILQTEDELNEFRRRRSWLDAPLVPTRGRIPRAPVGVMPAPIKQQN